MAPKRRRVAGSPPSPAAPVRTFGPGEALWLLRRELQQRGSRLDRGDRGPALAAVVVDATRCSEDLAVTGDDYNYPAFERRMFAEVGGFAGGPRPGEPAPAIDLPTISGEGFRLADCRGLRPVLLELGSITCPMAAGARPGLLRLWQDFGDRIEMVSVYVREAHPGQSYPRHRTREQKMRHARDWAEREPRPWTIAVDDLAGSVHRAYGALPNPLYLIDSAGLVTFRAVWAAAGGALRRHLEQLLEREARGRRPPSILTERTDRLLPLLRGAAEFDVTMARAGAPAARDVRRAMGLGPYAVQRLASRLRPLIRRE